MWQIDGFNNKSIKLVSFTGEQGEAGGGAAMAGAGDGVELGLDPLEELHGLLDGPRQLLPVLGQHVAVRLLHLITPRIN